MTAKLNLENKRFGRLKVLQDSGKRDSNGGVVWLCQCDCGNIKEANGTDLNRKHTVSCGCRLKETARENGKNSKTHGHTIDGKQTLTYNSWLSMKYRCLNPNQKAYRYYGELGITICERWMVFDNFLSDMGERPSKGYTLDREDSYGNYTADNCKWSTWKVQRANRRS